MIFPTLITLFLSLRSQGRFHHTLTQIQNSLSWPHHSFIYQTTLDFLYPSSKLFFALLFKSSPSYPSLARLHSFSLLLSEKWSWNFSISTKPFWLLQTPFKERRTLSICKGSKSHAVFMPSTVLVLRKSEKQSEGCVCDKKFINESVLISSIITTTST